MPMRARPKWEMLPWPWSRGSVGRTPESAIGRRRMVVVALRVVIVFSVVIEVVTVIELAAGWPSW